MASKRKMSQRQKRNRTSRGTQTDEADLSTATILYCPGSPVKPGCPTSSSCRPVPAADAPELSRLLVGDTETPDCTRRRVRSESGAEGVMASSREEDEDEEDEEEEEEEVTVNRNRVQFEGYYLYS